MAMSIDMQGWVFLSMYYLAQVLFLLASVILVRATKQISAYLCVIGFTAFLVGNVMMIEASKDLVEVEQTQGDKASVERYQSVGRMLSSVGFLAAGSGLFLFAVGRRRKA